MREQGVLEIDDEDVHGDARPRGSGRVEHPAAHRRLEGPLLHRLAAPADRRQVRRRPRLRRRPGDPVDARPRPAGGRREASSSSRSAGLGPTSAVVVARERQRRACWRWSAGRTSTRPVQPGHERPAPARVLVQAVHAGDRARGGATRPTRSTSPPRRRSRSRRPSSRTARRRRSPTSSGSTTTTTTTSAAPRSRPPRPTPTTRSTRSSAPRSGSTTSSTPRTTLGIASELDDNPAMILGGLKNGVTPLEMAYAYNTLANEGTQVTGTLGSRGNGKGPVAIEEVVDEEGDDKLFPTPPAAAARTRRSPKQVVDPAVARHRDRHPPHRRHQRHRQERAGRRRLHLGQDRDDRQQRRRLVRRCQRGHHRGGLGRLPGRRDPDDDRVRRRSRSTAARSRR